jgi:23S rRNA (uracil1939-C5)-methyltransferase
MEPTNLPLAEVTVLAPADRDQCLGHLDDGRVVFIHGPCAPGDRVLVELTKQRTRSVEAKLAEVLIPRPDRVAPPCPVFGQCGGCKWQMLPYEEEIQLKRQQVCEVLERVGQCDPDLVEAARPSPEPYGYRNKFEAEVSAGGTIEMHQYGDRVGVAIDACLLVSPAIAVVLKQLSDLLAREERNPGLGRISIREGAHQEVLLFAQHKKPSRWTPEWTRALPTCTSITLEQTRTGKFISIKGKPRMTYELAGLQFQVPAKSFFQINPAQAEILAQLVSDALTDRHAHRALDLFCGVGTFSLILARAGLKVHGIESDEAAIRLAQNNTTLNKLKGCSFETLQLGKAPLPDIASKADVILIDPPRSGIPPMLMGQIQTLSATTLLYISCDPGTFARDAKQLTKDGQFTLRHVTPVDMFPRTAHIELFALFERP